MDTLAHGLWTNIAAQRLGRRDRWWAIFFGVAPDVFSFGPFLAARLLTHTFVPRATPPEYVSRLYDWTHSLVIFAAVYLVVAFIRGAYARVYWRGVPWNPWWPLLAWALHIVVDTFTHKLDYFPTPFLFPLHEIRVNGISWADPTFMLVNYSLLTLAYLALFRQRKTTRQ